ncbi:MAG: diguanylate cyclase [Geobacteraceae bacterium GWC2_58_44]|nr:MAG: diguanylate cyclase [Geobacteraceae bacterium GWC2_58_44]HBG07815.1 diguanylate cyclase [Geobacter sp.]
MQYSAANCNRDTEAASEVVLIVDDDFTTRLLTREVLEQAGLTVHETDDGSHALALFDRITPDLVLLDVMMPGTDGFTVCGQIRKHPAGQNTPILMMTGLDDVESIRRAYEAGATDFITKPFNWLIMGYRVRYMMRANRIFQALGKSQASLSYAQRIAKMGSWEWDVEKDKVEWSDAVYSIFHIDPCGFDGTYQAFLNSVHPQDKEPVNAALEQALTGARPYSIDHRIMLSDGSERFVHSEARVVVDRDGRAVRVAGTLQDITERKQTEEKIRNLAFYDSLTGLPNRVLFKENLEHALAHAKRRGRRVGTLFLDLDRFKWINDTMGHGVGDRLLQELAVRLKQCVRKNDFVGRLAHHELLYSIARLGGDEFTIILDDIADPMDAATVARRVIEDVARPFGLEGYEVIVTASIGISIYPDDGLDIVTLIKHADTAMYHAKELGKNNFQFYTKSMTESAFQRLVLESQLRRALEREEFTLQYQPQVDLSDGSICCLEALIRWQSPELGSVAPASFIPLAEETGLILRIDEWVLATACNQLKAWQSAGLPAVRVAVNLSGQHFQHKTLHDTVRRIMKETGVPPGSLELELTEGVLMGNGEETVATLDALKGLGLTLAIDDFGTGYSSLSYLRRFQLDVLKIDQSFVRDVASNADSAAIVTAIVAMAKSLKLDIVAEGVETAEQLNFLAELGCCKMQGYLFSHPVTADQISTLLENGVPGYQRRDPEARLSPEFPTPIESADFSLKSA